MALPPPCPVGAAAAVPCWCCGWRCDVMAVGSEGVQPAVCSSAMLGCPRVGSRRRSLFWVLLALGTALMLGALGHGFSTGVAIPPVPLRTDVSEPSTGTHHTTHADQPDSHQRHAAFTGAHLRLNLSDVNPEHTATQCVAALLEQPLSC